jgi:hypothetical protein
MQHVRPRPPLPKALDLAPKAEGDTLQWERLAHISRELLPLFRRHWKEIALNQSKVELDPDWNRYFELELTGHLHILTARYSGLLQGYVFNLIGPHLHYVSTRWCQTDMFWMDPRSRRGWFPMQMLIENMRGLKEREVCVHNIGIKCHFQSDRMHKLMTRLGYKPCDIIYQKVL